MKKTKKTQPEIKDDPRVQALLGCVLFAINNFKNTTILDLKKKPVTMTTWHAWFREAIEATGVKLTEPKKKGKKT